ncbi:L-threonylcarbamoyladenylate synthase [Chloroflexota bacterium]
MQTQVITANVKKNIELAADCLLKGGLVAFPTETVYGLGADATSREAVSGIFTAKGRPAADPIIVHLDSTDMLPSVASEVPEAARQLADTFWPGPLTLILPKAAAIPDIVTSNLPTVAVRMPRNETALALIRAAGVPVAAPSANSFGRPSPTCARHVIDDLDGKIDLVLDGGPTPVGIESTILDMTTTPPVILRPGGISRESLASVLGEVSILATSEHEDLRAPGQMKQHYAPKALVLLFAGRNRQKVIAAMRDRAIELARSAKTGIMVPQEEVSQFNGLSENVITVSTGALTDPEETARGLFSTLRELDKKGVSHILTIAPAKEGIGLALFDRLYKSAGSRIITVDG